MHMDRTEIRVECGCGASMSISTEYSGDARAAAEDFYTGHLCQPQKYTKVYHCEHCGKGHPNEFSRTCKACDTLRESGDVEVDP